MSNLPEWPGADSVYKSLGEITRNMGFREYSEFSKRKKKRKSDKFVPSDELKEIIAAMNDGDEETLKGLKLQYIEYLDSVQRIVKKDYL